MLLSPQAKHLVGYGHRALGAWWIGCPEAHGEAGSLRRGEGGCWQSLKQLTGQRARPSNCSKVVQPDSSVWCMQSKAKSGLCVKISKTVFGSIGSAAVFSS